MPISHEPSPTQISESRLVIRAIRDAGKPLSYAELVEATGLPASRVLLAVLTARRKGYLLAVRPSPEGSKVELP